MSFQFLLVEPMDGSPPSPTLLKAILTCLGILKIKEMYATDRLGEWFVIGSHFRKHQLYCYLDENLPESFTDLQMNDLEPFCFEDFPYHR